MRKLHLDVRPSGFLLLSLLYFFSDGQTLAALLGSILLHEWGHMAVLRGCGARVREIRVDITGLCMDYSGVYLTRWQEFCAAAAGPLFGALGAWAASFWGNFFGNRFLLLFAGASLVLTVFNLLPIQPLDGWRMLRSVCGPVADGVSLAGGVFLLWMGLWCLRAGYGAGLGVMAVILLMQDAPSLPRRRRAGYS